MNANEVIISLNALADELVPLSGPANTVAGEIVRAICQIGYRWYNGGDRIGVGYGNQTCNPAARYLQAKAGSEVEKAVMDVWNISPCSDLVYKHKLQELNKKVLETLNLLPELKEQPNSEDMWDYQTVEDTTIQ